MLGDGCIEHRTRRAGVDLGARHRGEARRDSSVQRRWACSSQRRSRLPVRPVVGERMAATIDALRPP
jgi:hypothetical protein